MPKFEQKDLQPWQTILVHFKDRDAREQFKGLMKDNAITDETKYMWFPKPEIAWVKGQNYTTPQPVIPKYPIYVISKGRWEVRLTQRWLERMKVPYRMVVEPQEYDKYAAVVDPSKILVLPFSNLGQGSIPARNWVWEHSIGEGHDRHWILDDNIDGWWRLDNNLKIRVTTGAVFTAMETFSDRYLNVGISGPNYYMFAPRKVVVPPFTLNTRIYSCILIRNDIPYRWRGRYNEDTDLSIRALKDGWCTVLFNALLAKKATTMTMKGGNMETLYKDDGRLKMAESLRDQHPDIVTITEKWGRPQHHVDYSGFKVNKLELMPGVVIPDGPDDFGMELTAVAKTEEATGEPPEIEAEVPAAVEPEDDCGE